MSPAGNVTWLLRRLAVMSPGEIAHRAAVAGQAVGDRLAWRVTGRFPGLYRGPASAFDFMASGAAQLFPVPASAATLPVDSLLAEEVAVFANPVPFRPDPAFWHTDPRTGSVWPFGQGQRPEHRPGNRHGDARTVWEANRLQHLAGLAVVARDLPDRCHQAAAIFNRHVISWLDANPFPWGVQYASAMEAALRVIALLHAFDEFRNTADAAVRQAMADIACSHGWHIRRHLSLHSSAGNHTIAEAVGLLYLGLTLPEHPRSRDWTRVARQLLAIESARQIRADGGPLEQATWYLLFVTDLLGLAQRMLAHYRQPAIPAMDAAFDRARDFLGALSESRDRLPRIGDADDGHALLPGLAFAAAAEPASDPGRARSARPPRARRFPQTGISVTSLSGHDRLIFLTKDLGMSPNFGHGHADLLSVVFDWQDEPLLIEPGTYLYADATARRLFRSSTAHNTLAVADVDQATQAGPFLWRHPPRCQSVRYAADDRQFSELGWHDGFRSLGLRHWRGVLYLRDTCLAVWDRLVGPTRTGAATQHWHLGRRPWVRGANGAPCIAGPKGRPIEVETSGDWDPAAAPRAGSYDWPWSPTYGALHAGHGLAIGMPAADSELTTVFWLGERSAGQAQVATWRDECRATASAA